MTVIPFTGKFLSDRRNGVELPYDDEFEYCSTCSMTIAPLTQEEQRRIIEVAERRATDERFEIREF